ncbi:MAG: Dabb family protein [Oscillospiraceae bacterium]|nr:Dabb family protein [Oscillospiraceae bacterium]
MIKHIVMWKFKDGEEENMLKFRERLLALKGQIPEIKAMEVGINVNPSERSFDAVLVSEFDSLEDLRSYSVNPLHVAVSEFCKSIRTQSGSVDYEF